MEIKERKQQQQQNQPAANLYIFVPYIRILLIPLQELILNEYTFTQHIVCMENSFFLFSKNLRFKKEPNSN